MCRTAEEEDHPAGSMLINEDLNGLDRPTTTPLDNVEQQQTYPQPVPGKV